MEIITRQGHIQKIDQPYLTKMYQKLMLQANVSPPIEHLISKLILVFECGPIHLDKLNRMAARICSSIRHQDNQWYTLASRILIDNLHHSVSGTFSHAMQQLHKDKVISTNVYEIVQRYPHELNDIVHKTRDYLFDYDTMLAFEDKYLLRTNDQVVRETPQYMFLRLALELCGNHKHKVRTVYDKLSLEYPGNKLETLESILFNQLINS